MIFDVKKLDAIPKFFDAILRAPDTAKQKAKTACDYDILISREQRRFARAASPPIDSGSQKNKSRARSNVAEETFVSRPHALLISGALAPKRHDTSELK
jgi:hypothetical protein